MIFPMHQRYFRYKFNAFCAEPILNLSVSIDRNSFDMVLDNPAIFVICTSEFYTTKFILSSKICKLHLDSFSKAEFLFFEFFHILIRTSFSVSIVTCQSRLQHHHQNFRMDKFPLHVVHVRCSVCGVLHAATVSPNRLHPRRTVLELRDLPETDPGPGS